MVLEYNCRNRKKNLAAKLAICIYMKGACWSAFPSRCYHVGQQTNDLASFSLLILMMVGKIYNIWYSSCSGLLHMKLYRYASNFVFLSETWKSIRTGTPWEVHTKSPSCDQMTTGGLWASWCILATWTQDLVSVSYGFRKVHTGPCRRTGLNTFQGSPGVGRNTFLSSPHLCFIIVFICDLFVSRDDPLMS